MNVQDVNSRTGRESAIHEVPLLLGPSRFSLSSTSEHTGVQGTAWVRVRQLPQPWSQQSLHDHDVSPLAVELPVPAMQPDP